MTEAQIVAQVIRKFKQTLNERKRVMRKICELKRRSCPPKLRLCGPPPGNEAYFRSWEKAMGEAGFSIEPNHIRYCSRSNFISHEDGIAGGGKRVAFTSLRSKNSIIRFWKKKLGNELTYQQDINTPPSPSAEQIRLPLTKADGLIALYRERLKEVEETPVEGELGAIWREYVLLVTKKRRLDKELAQLRSALKVLSSLPIATKPIFGSGIYGTLKVVAVKTKDDCKVPVDEFCERVEFERMLGLSDN